MPASCIQWVVTAASGNFSSWRVIAALVATEYWHGLAPAENAKDIKTCRYGDACRPRPPPKEGAFARLSADVSMEGAEPKQASSVRSADSSSVRSARPVSAYRLYP